MLLFAAVLFIRYQQTSNFSEMGNATMERRIITDEIAFEKRHESDDARMYQTLQYLVGNKQKGFFKEYDAMDDLTQYDNELAN